MSQKYQESLMNKHSSAWLAASAAVSFIIAILLVLNDSTGPAAFFVIMGITWIGVRRQQDKLG